MPRRERYGTQGTADDWQVSLLRSRIATNAVLNKVREVSSRQWAALHLQRTVHYEIERKLTTESGMNITLILSLAPSSYLATSSNASGRSFTLASVPVFLRYVKDPSKTVGDLFKEVGGAAVAFARVEVGKGEAE